MILFDTNVISEVNRPECHPRVKAWLKQVDANDMGTTAVNLAEMRAGIAVLPDGKRKSALGLASEAFVVAAFGPRLFSFDALSAAAFAEIFADLKRQGKPIGFADCQIAAIARVHNCSVATRDLQPFRAAGLQVINPWADE